MTFSQHDRNAVQGITKSPTGIRGLDEITFGGLPKGRPTPVCGSAGAGKTLLASEFLVRGAVEFGEPGVFMAFEENTDELIDNIHSIGFDVAELIADRKIAIDYVHLERSEVEETGEYDLQGLFIRLKYAIDSIGAKRVVLDTVEALFAGLENHAVIRAELRRLFRWLKDQKVTAIVTGERGEKSLTRWGLEEYVADCVILLDHRVSDQVSTRRLRVVKYRGSNHGTNEYPFIITGHGMSVMPITSLRLDHRAPTRKVSTGIEKLDAMLGDGVFRGSSILVSGSPGTGKSSVAASFAAAACSRGEKALLFTYEESAEQLIRNMSSIGMTLAPHVESGLLKIHASRPTLQGLEQHLVTMHDIVMDFKPSVVVVDPITNFTFTPNEAIVKPTLMRLIDLMKREEITAMFTSLTSGDSSEEDSQVGVSSLMDTWLLLRNVEYNGERNRTIFVLKSRGTGHSNQIREFVMSGSGIDLVDVYLGADRVLTGTARVVQEQQESIQSALRKRNHERHLKELSRKQSTIEAKIAALKAEAEAEAEAVRFLIDVETMADDSAAESSAKMSRLRSQLRKVREIES